MFWAKLSAGRAENRAWLSRYLLDPRFGFPDFAVGGRVVNGVEKGVMHGVGADLECLR